MIQTYSVRHTVFRLCAFIFCAFTLGALLLACFLFGAPALAATPNATPYQDAPLRFVDDNGAPLANAALRLLCYRAANATSLTHDLRLQTNDTGTLVGALPADCSHIAALQLLHQQPGGKSGRESAYEVYDTSWQPGSRVILPAQGDIFIRREWRLVLFDVAIALEWDADKNSTYVNQFRDGMRNASAYLYDLSDGQMAFGALAISTGGEKWDSADIRIRAANDARPSARVGGIVAQRTHFTTSTGIEIVYAPGEILTGRGWDGDSAAIGDWSQPEGYRTLVHEWLHYALFLYDEYQQLGEFGRKERYCTCNELPQLLQNSALCGGESLAASAMAYHYTASELWLDGMPASCAESDQQLVYGGSDWQTLHRWGEIQGLSSEWLTAPKTLQSGPLLGLAGDLFASIPSRTGTEIYLPLVSRGGATQQRSMNALQQRHDLTATLQISGGNLDLAALNQFQIQIYIVQAATAEQPMRIVHQGTVTGDRQPPNQLGTMALLGVQPGDRLLVRADRYVRNNEAFSTLLYDAPLQDGQSTISLIANRWDGGLEVTPTLHNGKLDSLTLVLSSTLSLPMTPTVRLCSPDAQIGCNSGWQTPLHPAADGSWQGELQATSAAALPHFGYLWLDAGKAGTLIRWFQTAGGVGPAHMFGEAPLRDGLVMVDSTLSLSATQSAVLIMPADLQTLLRTPLPPGSNGLMGTPLDVKIASAGARPQVITTFFYGKDDLQRLGIGGDNTQLLRYDAVHLRWQPVVSLSSSSTLGWVASPPNEGGVYAVAWSAQPNVGKTPAILLDEQVLVVGDIIRTSILLPAASNAPLSATGTISYPLPTQLSIVGTPLCSIGICSYDAIHHTVHWQGTFGNQRGVLLSLESSLEDSPTCALQLVHNATVFDGVQSRTLNAFSTIECSPIATATTTTTTTSTATVTATPITPNTATPTIATATPITSNTATPTISATATATATPTSTATLTGTTTSKPTQITTPASTIVPTTVDTTAGTATETPVATITPTPNASLSPTETSVTTPAVTPSPPTLTVTPSSTPIPSITPSLTPFSTVAPEGTIIALIRLQR